MVNYRSFTVEDLPQVEELYKISSSVPWEISSQKFIKDQRTLLERWDHISFVAESEVTGALVGYLAAGVKLRTNNTLQNDPISRKGFIHSIAVDPNYRRKTIGSQLLFKSCTGMIHEYGLQQVVVEVEVDDSLARHFLKKQNFVPQGEPIARSLGFQDLQMQLMELEIGPYY